MPSASSPPAWALCEQEVNRAASQSLRAAYAAVTRHDPILDNFDGRCRNLDNLAACVPPSTREFALTNGATFRKVFDDPCWSLSLARKPVRPLVAGRLLVLLLWLSAGLDKRRRVVSRMGRRLASFQPGNLFLQPQDPRVLLGIYLQQVADQEQQIFPPQSAHIDHVLLVNPLRIAP